MRWAAIAGLTSALSACTSESPVGGDGSPTGDSAPEGSLVVLTESGSHAAYAPKRSPYYYTHGFLICRDGGSGDEPLFLRSVSYNVNLQPLEVKPAIRRIPEEIDRRGPDSEWTPILGLLGRPGAFDNWTVRGDFSYDFDGTEVTASCEDASEFDSAKMELEIVMKVPKAGADIDGFTITYEVNGEDYDVHVPWRLTGCGSEVDPEICTPPD